MPALTITQPTAPRRASHPKAVLRTEKGRMFVLPFAPRGTELGGFQAPLTVTPRPGRKPLVLVDGDGIETMGVTFPLARGDHQQPVEDFIRDLRAVATSRQRVTFVNLSPRERGPWRISDLTITGELRQAGTNHITRATVTLALTQASDAAPKVGPVSGGHSGNGPDKRPKTYVIRKGDTLRSIANRFYGDPSVWPQIAKANGIKAPNNLKPGRKIKLPKISTGDDWQDA